MSESIRVAFASPDRGLPLSSSMQIAASFHTSSLSGHQRRLDLCIGDVTESAESVDLLCISAFPNDYTPTPHSVIGALDARGISVQRLARDKAHDWRGIWHCWISKPLSETRSPARRIVCFEHEWAGASALTTTASAPDLVGNVFRAVREVVLSESPLVTNGGDAALECIRLPLLASGDQQVDRGDMLDATIRQGYLSLVGQLPVKRMEIVLHPGTPDLHQLLVRAGQAFEQVRSEWTRQHLVEARDHDFFVSYRHSEVHRVDPVINAMRTLEPGVRIFIDHERLQLGSFWKADLMGELARSERSVCFITDDYPESPECMDEFHASLCIARERADGFLRPVLRLTSRSVERLPATVRRVQCIDASAPDLTPQAVARRVLHG